jgi:hypothetical protein
MRSRLQSAVARLGADEPQVEIVEQSRVIGAAPIDPALKQ